MDVRPQGLGRVVILPHNRLPRSPFEKLRFDDNDKDSDAMDSSLSRPGPVSKKELRQERKAATAMALHKAKADNASSASAAPKPQGTIPSPNDAAEGGRTTEEESFNLKRFKKERREERRLEKDARKQTKLSAERMGEAQGEEEVDDGTSRRQGDLSDGIVVIEGGRKRRLQRRLRIPNARDGRPMLRRDCRPRTDRSKRLPRLRPLQADGGREVRSAPRRVQEVHIALRRGNGDKGVGNRVSGHGRRGDEEADRPSRGGLRHGGGYRGRGRGAGALVSVVVVRVAATTRSNGDAIDVPDWHAAREEDDSSSTFDVRSTSTRDNDRGGGWF